MYALYFLTSYLVISTVIIVAGGALLWAQDATDEPSHLSWPWTIGIAVLSGTLLFFLYQEFGTIWPWVLHFATFVYGTIYNIIKTVQGPRPVNWTIGLLGLFLSWVTVLGYWSYV